MTQINPAAARDNDVNDDNDGGDNDDDDDNDHVC